jgi:hypothetical protein
VGTEEEASVLVGFLDSSGIPAEVESLLSSEFPADIGHLGEVRVRVPAEHAQAALELLNSREDVATGEEGEMAGAALTDASSEEPEEEDPTRS